MPAAVPARYDDRKGDEVRERIKIIGKDLKRDRLLYLFLLVPVIYIIVFAYLPMGDFIWHLQITKPERVSGAATGWD